MTPVGRVRISYDTPMIVPMDIFDYLVEKTPPERRFTNMDNPIPTLYVECDGFWLEFYGRS